MKHIYTILGLVAAFVFGGLFFHAVLPLAPAQVQQAVNHYGAVAQTTVQDLIINGNATTTGSNLVATTSTFASNAGTIATFALQAGVSTSTLDMSQKKTCLVVQSASGTVLYATVQNPIAGSTTGTWQFSQSGCY